MTEWEKKIERHFGRQGYRTDWVRTKKGPVFLLAWRGREVHVIFTDGEDELLTLPVDRVKEYFIGLLVQLIPDPDWEGVFKAREVFFKWATNLSSLDPGARTLDQAGVERFYFPRLGELGSPALGEEEAK